MPDEMTSILNMLYPSREPSPYALQALFGFGPKESFDLLRSMKLFPTEAAGAEEKVKSAKLANIMSEIGIPQRQAEVESFLSAPQALQFFGPQHYTTEGVATYQKPELAVGKMEAGTKLTEAQVKQALANADYTEAETQRIMAAIREASKFGGPSQMEAMLSALKGAGTRALPLFQEGYGLNIPAATELSPSPEEALKKFVIPQVIEAVKAGDLKKAEAVMSLIDPRALSAIVRPPTKGKEQPLDPDKQITLIDPDTNKAVKGIAKILIPQISQKRAARRLRTESSVIRKDSRFSKLTDAQLLTAMTKQETNKIIKEMQEAESALLKNKEEISGGE